jgi:hypothetical protein
LLLGDGCNHGSVGIPQEIRHIKALAPHAMGIGGPVARQSELGSLGGSWDLTYRVED